MGELVVNSPDQAVPEKTQEFRRYLDFSYRLGGWLRAQEIWLV